MQNGFCVLAQWSKIRNITPMQYIPVAAVLYDQHQGAQTTLLHRRRRKRVQWKKSKVQLRGKNYRKTQPELLIMTHWKFQTGATLLRRDKATDLHRNRRERDVKKQKNERSPESR